jgi:lipopolysaccharide/colanic/teichoic acid biosynthesis glycosyltransferase
MIMKRLFDILLSSTGLILSSPLWLIFSIAIWLEDRGPIFYLQERVGRDGKIFKAIKFRSMIPDAEKHSGVVQAVENDPRVTKVGRVLGATAMDELPQLINILKGDMSFVGRRSLRPNEKEVHGNPDETSIEDIPGLTGIAQVYLPGDALRKEKFKYDLQYIKNQSFLLDLKLIFLSFWITFRGKWESRQKKI